MPEAHGFTEKLMESLSIALDSKVVVPAPATVGTVTTTTTYVAEAKPGTALATAAWRVKRIVEVADSSDDSSTTTTTWAGGTSDRVHAATDLPALFA